MKKILVLFILVAVVTAVVAFGLFVWKNWKALQFVATAPYTQKSDKEIEKIKNIQEDAPEVSIAPIPSIPLILPDGFSISVFANNLDGARVIRFDKDGNMWVSRTKDGIVSLLKISQDSVVDQVNVFTNLNNPHGLVFDQNKPELLYVAEEHAISKVYTTNSNEPEKIIDLPAKGEGHFTRTLGIGPDNRLYVSIGSSCNVCIEQDRRRAAIYSLNTDGSDFREFAKGLRNAVFFIWSPFDNKMWATEMGRDWLGDDLPPDEIDIIEQEKNYGWPYCYGKQVHDVDFDSSDRVQDICEKSEPSYIDIPAHSAPLGLTFVPEEERNNFPEEYGYDLFVAYHGSWNRTVPTGYKVVRFKFDKNGAYYGAEDFISGWLDNDGEVWGRPVDIVMHNGAMYVSDDKAGVIYKIVYNGENR